MNVDKDEVEAWMRLPVTQWLVQELHDRYPCAVASFIGASNWDETNKLRGRAEVFSYLNDPVELWRLTRGS